MIAATDTVTLLLAIIAIFVAASFVWWALAAGAKLAPRASHMLALTNAFLAGSLACHAMRGAEPSLIAYHGSDVLGIAAFALLRAAVPAVSDQPLAWRSGLAVTLIGTALLASRPYGAADMWHEQIVYLCLSALSLLASLDAWRRLRQRLRPLLTALLIAPLFLVFALLAMRLAETLWAPERAPDIRLATESNIVFLWSTLVLNLVLNATMACLILMRLILRIQRLTEHDPLTDVLNRRMVGRALASAHARWLRGKPYALVMIDMDRFKQLNDTLGHAAGDAALKRLVAVLRDCVREVDRIGRLGGEEFCVVLPLTNIAGAALVAERMRKCLAEGHFEWQGKTWPLTASFGVAEAESGDVSPEAVLGRADQAMYRAKAQGRNVVQGVQR